MDIKKKENSSLIINELKNKGVELLSDYIENKVIKSQKDITKYIEKQIEKKIKYEIKRQIKYYTFILSSLLFLLIGSLFLLYFILELIINSLNIPLLFLNLTYSVIILIIAFILYINA